ncbi:MAG TPA: ABC transporter ATP-binding protein, partial [bacterium]|nr:ABC transporter ATP-binding protein [bacterium]
MSRENSIVYAVEDLVYGVNGKRILSGVDFSVNAGEFVSVIGPNGAGKSTLLRLLVRTIKPRSGKILLFGRELSGYRQRDIALKVGYVPQSSPDYVPFTALQFVLMGRYPASNPLVRPGAEDAKAAMEILDKVGLADFAQRRVDTLSGGERQKVFIAAALAQTPEALLLDEPTTFLDPKHQADIRE